MNETIALLISHRSHQDFLSDPIAETDLDAIVEAAWRGPTSSNGQQVSLVVVRDAARRQALAEIAGGQPWIVKAPVFLVVLIDFHKTAAACREQDVPHVVEATAEGLLIGGIDAGIALGNLMVAARGLGYAVRAIGGIRRDGRAIAELLHLPPRTFPVCGLCIGHGGREPARKPRLDIATFRHDETYCDDGLAEAIADYDRKLAAHWQDCGRADGRAWSESIARSYRKPLSPDLAAELRRQGFRLEE